MITLLTGGLVLSFLHAILPNHWLPVLAISRQERWDLAETTRVTLIAGISHAASTILIGVLLAFVGLKLASAMETFAGFIAPALLTALGLFYLYQHYRHHHFHLHGNPELVSRNKIIASLVTAMFLSPCFEIEAYFLVAGTQGWWLVVLLAGVYATVTVVGMIIWVRLAYRGLLRINWHSLEHNAGIITGATLVISGVLAFLFR